MVGEKQYSYLVRVQYLGFRYSGWQKQLGQKTVEGMLVKTLKFVLPGASTKILGAGRTDAKVSSLDGAFELFTNIELGEVSNFIKSFNKNLPSDIRVLSCKKIDNVFNVIKDVEDKEYHYFFSFGKKNHPFCAPFMANFVDDLDIKKMKMAAVLFEGTHNFRAYTPKRGEDYDYRRTIGKCILVSNKYLTASFFPEKSYVLKVKGKGFMRYQIRMIMGALIGVGKGKLSISEIEDSLKENSEITFSYVAPGSGLQLYDLRFCT